MSNVLNIVVLNCQRVGYPEDKTVVALASDHYGDAVMTFDDMDHLKDCYPSKEDLIVAVLCDPAFEGGAIIYQDGTYELDSISAIEVEGYPG